MLRELSDIKNSNIWQEAGKVKKKEGILQNVDKTMIVIGQQGSGKTSFIKVIKGQIDQQAKPTCLLQYNYIKRLSLKKQIIHSYEIASKNLSQIIPSLISKDNFSEVYFVICVDLNRPSSLIEDVNEALTSLRKQFNIFIKEKLINKDERYRQFQTKILDKLLSSVDRSLINPMPLNTIIVGCKYDLYQKFDTQNRKWISRCLRYLAHTNNCSLFYSSIKNMQLGGQLRTILIEFMFGDKKNESNAQKDHIKPIFIINGQDDVNSMGLPTSSIGPVQILKKQLGSIFPEEPQKKRQAIDLTKYTESKIDTLISKNKKELAKIAKGIRNIQI